MQESQVRFLGDREDPLEKEMATPLQYSCLGNSMDREPGGLQSTGSQKSRTQRLNDDHTTTVAYHHHAHFTDEETEA